MKTILLVISILIFVSTIVMLFYPYNNSDTPQNTPQNKTNNSKNSSQNTCYYEKMKIFQIK